MLRLLKVFDLRMLAKVPSRVDAQTSKTDMQAPQRAYCFFVALVRWLIFSDLEAESNKYICVLTYSKLDVFRREIVPENGVPISRRKFQILASDADPGERLVRSRPLETYKSNLIHHNFVQFGQQHSRYKAILPSIVLSQ